MYLLDSVMSIGEALNVSITGIVVVFIVLVVWQFLFSFFLSSSDCL